MPTDPHHILTIIQPSTSQPQKKQKPRKPKRKDTEVPQPSGLTTNVADEVVYKEIDDSLERAATTATSLDAEQDRGNINKTQSKATLNELSSLGTSLGSGPRRQETMGDTIAQTGFKNVSKTSNDSLLAGVNTPRSGEDSLKLNELMELCTNLQNRVIDLEKTKTSQAQEITIESSEDKGLGKEDASKQGRIADIDVDAGINLVSTHFDADTDMFGVHDLVGDEAVVETEVAVKAASTIPVYGNYGQFWATVKAKTVNGEVQLQALVDGKKIIITESIVRRDLQLEDAEGVDCLPNATIFEQLTLMGAKTTAWNEFSSTMASAIIYLATNQKFNFSKYIFESMVKNLDNAGKFLMYPRFVQVFVNQQLEGMPAHKRLYNAPSHTKKIFRNIRRIGKGFSGRETPLFQTIVVQAQAKMGEGSANPTDPHHTPTIIQPSTSQPQKKQRPRKPKRKNTEIPQFICPTTNVADEAVNEEMDDSLERAATTATGLDAEHDRGNIDKTQSKATLNESSSSGTSSGSGPRRQETMGDTIAQTRFENVSKTSNDPLLARGNTLRSGEDRLKLEELMAFCTTLQSRVLALETTKTTQANEIDSLKRRVKRLEKKDRKRTYKLKRLYKVGLTAKVESSDEEGLGEEDASKQGRRIHDIDADEDITLVNDQDDADMFGVNDLDGDEAKLVSAAEETDNAVATTVSTVSIIPVTDVEITLAQALAELKSAKPKANKVVIQEPKQEQVKPMKRLEQMRIDEELAFKLQAEEEEEEERLAREKSQQVEEANIAWDDVQSKIKADYQLAQRLKAQEQEELTDAEKERLFVQFLEQRRKHFAAKRAEEKRNKPLTRAHKGVSSIKRVNTFVDYRTKLVEESSKKANAEIAQESSSKRAGKEMEQESSKRQKLEEDKESEELKQCLEIIPDDGDDMLKNFDREDLEVLWSIVKARFKKTEPVNYMDNFLLLNLKTMFEHHVKDNNMLFYLLVEKMYPLTNHILHQMFNDVKLQVDYECEMAFELLRLVKKLLKEGYGRIVGIKSLLKVTTVKYKSYNCSKIKTAKTAERVSTVRSEWIKTEERIKIDWRSRLLT
ncbi:hypothetical protein Tco_0504614 [Tanacetum coccineum]